MQGFTNTGFAISEVLINIINSIISGKDFVDVLKANINRISPKFKEITGLELGSSEKNYCQNFYIEYLKRAMILKVVKPEEEKKKKYPKFLIGDKELETFEDSKYYWTKMDFPKSNKNNVYLIVIIILILMFCMFSLWPLWFKLFVWWILFISLCFMVYLFSYFSKNL